MIGRSTRSAFLPGHKEPAKVRVFFYGLFMDETILAEKGVTPSWATSGFVDGFRLYIGKRATLVREANSRSWGVMVDIAAADDIAKIETLYAEQGVADYLPEMVFVELPDGARHRATCYILPGATVSRTSQKYADELLALATRLGFPETYLEQIRHAKG